MSKEFSVVEKGGKQGLFNASNKEVIPCEYDMVVPLDYSNGLCKVEKANKWGLVNPKGKVTDLIYDSISIRADEFADEEDDAYYLIYAERNGHLGMLDSNGKEAIPFIYDDMDYPYDDMICVMKDDLYGFYDMRGNIVVGTKYDNAQMFANGYAIVSNNEGKFGMIDAKGNEVVELKYDYISNMKDGTAIVGIEDIYSKKMQHGVVNSAGKLIVPTRYDDVISSTEKNGSIVEIYGKQGYYDPDGNLVGDTVYKEIKFIDNLDGSTSVVANLSGSHNWNEIKKLNIVDNTKSVSM